jgi:hypothetical protein
MESMRSHRDPKIIPGTLISGPGVESNRLGRTDVDHDR